MRRQSTFREDPGEIVARVREWIETVTGKELGGDIRDALQNGIILCELMAKVRPGSIQRVNKLNSPIAHLDNIRSFLQACRVHFLLNEAQLFDVTDLQDPEQRSGAFTSGGAKGWGAEKRLKNVCVTLYWIGRKLAEEESYQGPIPDLSVFHPVLPGQTASVPIPEEPEEEVFRLPRSQAMAPLVPSRPDPDLVPRVVRQEQVSASEESDSEVTLERVELNIVPLSGSFGFHLLSKAVEGSNTYLSTVHSVLEDSSAGRAGLQRGDELVMVNGMDTSYFQHQQIVKLIKDSIVAQSLTVVINRKKTVPRRAPVSEKGESVAPFPPPQATEPSPPPEEPPKQEDPPTHHVIDTEETALTRYRPVPPVPLDEPEQAIYVNQTLLDRVERELPLGKETAQQEKPKRSPSKDRSPRNKKRTQERVQPEGSSEMKEQIMGAKTPRSQMPLPPPPLKDIPPAPNSEPTRRRFFGSKKGGESSPTKKASWKAGWKEAVVQSVEVTSPSANLESVRLEQSEESGEDRMERKRRELLAKDRNNRVSMTDPFKGILPVSDGRSLLDEIFPDGENSHIGPLLQEDSLLKTPPQQRQHPSKEYFAKVLNPQISQPETFQPSPLVSQDVRLREREPERARHSPTRSSGSSERHSAKLVGSLLASSGAQITPVDDRRKERREEQVQLQKVKHNKQQQPQRQRQQQQQQQPPPQQPPQQQQQPQPQPQPQQQQQPNGRRQQQQAPMSTQSLPQYAKPPQAPGPSNSSVSSSPPRQQPNPPPNTYTQQQIPTGYQDRSKISRAKSFTGSHPSRESSDERNFSHMMTRGYAGSDYSHGQNSKQEFRQRGHIQRGQSMKQDVASHAVRPVIQQYRDPRMGPYMHQQTQYPQTAGYPQFPSYQTQYPSYAGPAPAPVRQQRPVESQLPQDGHYASNVFRINQTNASIPCTSCNIPLGVGAATGVQGLPNIYHPHCFCCDVCGSQLFESTFLLRGTLHCKCCKDSQDGSLSTVC